MLYIFNKMYFLLYFLFCFALIGCKDQDSDPKPIVKVEPKIDISYTMLAGGYVQFTNNSKNLLSTKWSFSDQHGKRWTSRKNNPKFFFYDNGEKQISVDLKLLSPLRDTSVTVKINIENALNIKDTLGFLQGKFFNKKFNRTVQSINSFSGGGIAVLPPGTPTIDVYAYDSLTKIVIGDFNKPTGLSFDSMVENFKPGLKKLRGSSAQEGFLVVFPYVDSRILLGQKVTDSLFIEEAKVVSHPKIIPEMTGKAILVKMRIKGDFDNFGIVDCVLYTKLYHYE